MAKSVELKDGIEVIVRPLVRDDFDRSIAFFKSLPREDRDYLRGDPTQPDVLERRFQEMESGEISRMVAVVNDEIVAEASLEMTGRDWTKHVGEVRLIVADQYRRKGLGMLMAHEIYSLAASYRLEKLMVTIMRPQVAARSIFRKLGFREEMVLPDHVRDRKGRSQDLILMRCDLEALWKELESF
jgi:L-amino acid N-acyltransferase YncA